MAVDVGNTAATIGLYPLRGPKRQPVPAHIWHFPTSQINTTGPFQKFLHARLGRSLEKVEGAIVASVVPPIDHNLHHDLESLLGFPPVFVDHRSPSPIRIRYKKPSEVGADRIVNARAAWELHRGASIVIDFGTATTFDCVSRRGEYVGGVIAPGPLISAEALYRRTAKLPMVFLDKPAGILADNTLNSIRAGLYHGYRGLVREITRQIRKKLGDSVRIFTTGGQAAWILKGLPGIGRNIPTLTLDGLYHLWYDRRGSK
jgi:type III pantothenate kinase